MRVPTAGFGDALTPGDWSTSTLRCCRLFRAADASARTDSGCRVAGATVHQVTTELDHGPILAQSVPVLPDDNPETLAARVLTQESIGSIRRPLRHG